MKAIIFDMDGVLVDSFEAHRQAFDAVMKKHFGFNVTKKEFLGYFGRDPRDITRMLIESHGIRGEQNIEKIHAEKQEEFRSIIKEGVKTFPGVREVLSALKQRKVKIGLASSNSLRNIIPLLEKTGLERYFDACTGLEDSKMAKPNPEIYLKTAVKLNVKPEECWVIEDSLPGIEAGKKAGMKVVGVQTGMRSKRELEKAGADMVVETLEQLKKEDLENMIL